MDAVPSRRPVSSRVHKHVVRPSQGTLRLFRQRRESGKPGEGDGAARAYKWMLGARSWQVDRLIRLAGMQRLLVGTKPSA